MDSKQDVHPKIRNWCARAERSPRQVLKKLRDWGASENAEAQLSQLEEEGFVDAARFANAFAADQIRLKNWGPSKVYAALRQVHGLAGNLASEALAEVGEDEVNEAAFRSAKSWLRVRSEIDQQKAIAALLRKGFSFESASRAVQAAIAD